MRKQQNFQWKELNLGTCYYPEHWDPALWRDDLRRMKANGIFTIRIAEFAWNKIEPHEGEFTFEFFDQFLDVAEGMAGFFLNNPSLPDDGIPLWDFNAGQTGYHKDWKFDETALGYIPRDASAAAILSSALFELYTFTHNEAYFDSARRMLYALASGSYRAEEGTNSGFLLKHSTGSLPHGKEIDVPLVYADYYFLEALCRYERLLDGISLQ